LSLKENEEKLEEKSYESSPKAVEDKSEAISILEAIKIPVRKLI
jgi:hypothetical protein